MFAVERFASHPSAKDAEEWGTLCICNLEWRLEWVGHPPRRLEQSLPGPSPTNSGTSRALRGKRNVRFTATLTGYAYETIPNKTIVTGQTKDSNEIGIEEQVQLSICPLRPGVERTMHEFLV
jgi:hypothetical protein